MTVGQAVCQLLCRCTQSTLVLSCVCWIVPIATCTLSKELVGVHVWNAPDQWYNRRTAPCQAKCKNRAPRSCILIFTILLVSVDCYFLRFSECFPVISGLCIAVQYRVCYCFSTIFWVWPVGSLQLSFSMAQTSSYVTAPDQSKVVLQVRAMCRASSNILQ